MIQIPNALNFVLSETSTLTPFDEFLICNYNRYKCDVTEEGVSVTNSTRFSIAIHVLCFLDFFKQERITSELLSMSVNTNAVVVRRVTSLLKKAKLIYTTPGVNANISLARPVEDITLLDVYRAVIQPTNDDLFVIHKNTNPSCPVGSHIPSLLENTYTKIDQVLEDELASISLDTLVQDIFNRNQSSL